MKKVLVLEDESSIRSFIVINLRRAGYDVIEAETGEEALERLKEHPDTKVALLDIMLPGIDGFEVCRRIRATNTKIGIIMLTARSQEMDKVTGLMTGADDYVTKPFSPAELTARVDALFRRGKGLGHIVVGAGHQARHLVHLLGPGGEHNDADAGIRGPDAAADLKAVDTGQHNVQQRHSGIRILLQPLQRILAGLRLDDVISSPAQIDHDKAADAGFILQNQYLLHGPILSILVNSLRRPTRSGSS